MKRSPTTPTWLVHFDRAVIGWLRRRGGLVLRLALGVVYVWFGLLKVFGVSPVAELVAESLSFVPAGTALWATGAVEVLIGLGLVTGFAVRVTVGLVVLQLIGTFVVGATRPDLMLEDGRPLVLSVLGEFVVKNVVLMAAALVVVAGAKRATPAETVGELLTDRPRD